MKYLHGILFVCLLFSNVLTSVRAADAEDEYLNDDYDYENEDISEDVPVDDHQPDLLLATTSKPYFKEQEVMLYAKPGDDLMINCDVRNFQLRNAVIWYKGEAVIVNGPTSVSQRVDAMKNNSILLKDIQTDDAGDYYCEVLPDRIRLHVDVKVSGTLAIKCDGREVTDRQLIFRQGETHEFECVTYTNGKMDIKWSFNGQRAESDVIKVDGNKMLIDNIDSEHIGVYQCLGDDGSQEPPHGMVSIDVHYSPKVSTHRHHVNAENGGNAELYCDYSANPIAITHWMKQGKVLSYSEKYSIKNTMHNNRNRTVLTVSDIDTKDIGEYECQVENTIGSNEMKVYLQYEPETPQFEEIEINGNQVTLHWLVRSVQPLSEAMLDYKLYGSYTWSTVSMIHSRRHVEHNDVWKLTHKMELVEGTWHARVKTKNTVGWSKFSAQHDFIIRADEDEDNDNSLSQDKKILSAGVGVDVGGHGGAGATRQGMWPQLVMGAFAVALLRFSAIMQC